MNNQVLYQLGHVYSLLGDRDRAVKWFVQLIGVVPSDAGILARLGWLAEDDDDRTRAFHYLHDSFRYDPNDVRVIEWLGKYYVDSHCFEKVWPHFSHLLLYCVFKLLTIFSTLLGLSKAVFLIVNQPAFY